MRPADAPPILPRPLRVLGGRALERALNRAVALDPDTVQRLRALDGRRIDLHLEGPNLDLSVSVAGGRLMVGPIPTEAAGSSLRVAATPGSLLAMALRRDDDGVAPGKVEIAGDADLARRLEKLFRTFAPDVEEAFARTFGDVAGVPLARAIRRGLAHFRRSARHTVEDTADWLREEARVALAPGELEPFLDDVDLLRERTERLEARIRRLSRQTEHHA
ncbi:SCP2 sterol-binding domain-containing protein [Oleiagrimonas sp. C23AA]|uniref:ubiquinone biosynthesis accessory factor UbiJ n=1 Tax=Oleiagrimonas sp. C23AA TaxID=2719047 RepID=UPI00141FFB2D|nr:SCP2 sterol-binding domain-containing protein [Oleiagrimonas sp. C23AA]NII10903.1 sterol-binding protein [Oleiagrimonas sp. C23AA]